MLSVSLLSNKRRYGTGNKCQGRIGKLLWVDCLPLDDQVYSCWKIVPEEKMAWGSYGEYGGFLLPGNNNGRIDKEIDRRIAYKSEAFN